MYGEDILQQNYDCTHKITLHKKIYLVTSLVLATIKSQNDISRFFSSCYK